MEGNHLPRQSCCIVLYYFSRERTHWPYYTALERGLCLCHGTLYYFFTKCFLDIHYVLLLDKGGLLATVGYFLNKWTCWPVLCHLSAKRHICTKRDY